MKYTIKLLAYILLGGSLLLTACSGAGGDTAVVTSDATSKYQLSIASSDVTPNESRLVLVLWDGVQRLTGVQALEVALFQITDDGSPTNQVWEGEAKSYEMSGLQYWVSYPTFPAPGLYGVATIATDAAGEQVENQAVLTVKEATDAPALGAPVPPSETRTLADGPVEELTSAGPYIESFYEMTVADAATSGKPSIISFSTPGYCESALCTPVMLTLQEIDQEVGEQLNIVHVEVWRDYAERKIDPAVEEWGLPSEPWLFILNADGTVGARLDGPVSPEELRENLAEVTEG